MTAFALISYGKRDFAKAGGLKTVMYGRAKEARVVEGNVEGANNFTLGQNGVTWRKRPKT